MTFQIPNKLIAYLLSMILAYAANTKETMAQSGDVVLHYSVSMPHPASHYYHVELNVSSWNTDTIVLKMPQWMPGYYQLMNYALAVENLSAKDNSGKNMPVKMTNENSWQIVTGKTSAFNLNYDVKADKQFVAKLARCSA